MQKASFAKPHFEMVSCVTLKGQCYLIRVNKLNLSTEYAKNKGYNYFLSEGPWSLKEIWSFPYKAEVNFPTMSHLAP